MDPTVSFPENWTPPRELARALPRETQLSRRGIFMAALAAILLVAAIPLFLFLRDQGTKQRAQTEALRTQGRDATGEITRLWHRGRSSTPMVSYAFTADEVRIHGEASVPGKLWDGMQKAGFIPIRYLPSSPTVNHPAAWEENAEPAWVPVVLPGVLALGGVFLLMNLRRQAVVVAEGLPTAGVITKCFRVKGGWAVRYQFRTKDGSVTKGSDQIYRRLEAGSTVCVLYLPERPRRNQLYPGCLYRVATQ